MDVGLPAPPSPPAPPPRNQKAIWALVLGVLGIWPLTLLASIPALILGYQARGEIRRSGGTQRGRGMALAETRCATSPPRSGPCDCRT